MKFSIGHRLFVSVLLAILAVAAGAVFLLRQNVLAGFGDYAVAIELDRLDELSAALAARYRNSGDWRFIADEGRSDWVAQELERLQRVRAAALRREAAVLDEQLRAMVLRSPVNGVVLTSRPEERLGAWLAEGDGLVLVGRTDTLELEFGVDQRDVARVGTGDEVRLRVDALPQHTFAGRVASIGQVPAETAVRVTFPVRALVGNESGVLRPGMAAHARVLTAPASAAGRMLRAPLRQARLLWWRLWS